MEETYETQNFLGARRSADEPSSTGDTTEKPLTATQSKDGTAPETIVLDDRHIAVLQELLRRASWPFPEFQRITAKQSLMPWACMARLNEWAMNTHGDLLLEGDHILDINQNLKAKM